jgi:hypothetical protein
MLYTNKIDPSVKNFRSLINSIDHQLKIFFSSDDLQSNWCFLQSVDYWYQSNRCFFGHRCHLCPPGILTCQTHPPTLTQHALWLLSPCILTNHLPSNPTALQLLSTGIYTNQLPSHAFQLLSLSYSPNNCSLTQHALPILSLVCSSIPLPSHTHQPTARSPIFLPLTVNHSNLCHVEY